MALFTFLESGDSDAFTTGVVATLQATDADLLSTSLKESLAFVLAERRAASTRTMPARGVLGSERGGSLCVPVRSSAQFGSRTFQRQ